MRFFTADWHFGMAALLDKKRLGKLARPFRSVEEMDEAIVGMANSQAKPGDVVVHLGDLGCVVPGKEKPMDKLKQIHAVVVNVHGNHDSTNRIKSFCSSFRTVLGKTYTDVSASHYPTNDRRAAGQFLPGDVHLCGHVHGKWVHLLDLASQCFNVNVGVDAWGFKMLSEDELVRYIKKTLDSRKLNVWAPPD